MNANEEAKLATIEKFGDIETEKSKQYFLGFMRGAKNKFSKNEILNIAVEYELYKKSVIGDAKTFYNWFNENF